MICYRDRTFCTFYETCVHAKDCSRPLTPEVKEAARKWWGGDDAPISFFVEMPECHSDRADELEEWLAAQMKQYRRSVQFK